MDRGKYSDSRTWDRRDEIKRTWRNVANHVKILTTSVNGYGLVLLCFAYLVRVFATSH